MTVSPYRATGAVMNRLLIISLLLTTIRRANAARYSSVLQMAGCHHARTAVVPLLVARRVRRGAVNSFWIMPRGI
jgi:hypothetical protein